ncbi:hypothetical protein N7468_007002 [Penicillium chermesinum]|uniref:Uncharacterized protein n=1 Tax=Penicillium chermesinum TaxID=63820 RepID=A0A9W9NT99_9EURO|nr:uncharacterized protein N7468_007002 [Penicillium chermesinum]KAJ5225777.1 hypothetical protein N7468_007002 [Penicillium chermesinum]
MPVKEDTSLIVTAARKFMEEYSTVVLSGNSSPDKTEVSTKMATYYRAPLVFIAGGKVGYITDDSRFPPLIKGILDKSASISPAPLVLKEIEVKVVAEKSAVVWLHLSIEDIEASNVYFIRMDEEGVVYCEGGIFDGENFLSAQLEKLHQ